MDITLILLISAAVISMAVIPLMMRAAPWLGMIDLPSGRKVHETPVSRVGGIGIVVGALLPLMFWLPADDLLRSFLFGSAVLLVFGAADDARELGHYVKFIGQGIAVIAVVYFGDLWVSRFPFMDDPIPAAIGKPFTVIAMIGVINAMNHSDGLDGLASGEALLSLIAIVYVSSLGSGNEYATAVAMVTIGGLFGFLRFNTHPARVFMGDSGSQFLGFTIGFLAILLTQRVNTAVSPAVVLLLIGLPVVDIIAVLFLRIKGGMNWFRATRNHIHHRLMDRGFAHYETVVIIYSVQTLLVASGILLRYAADWVLIAFYLAVCGTVFVLLMTGERRDWRAGGGSIAAPFSAALGAFRESSALRRLPLMLVLAAVPLFMAGGAMTVSEVPRDFAIISAVLFFVLLTELLVGRRENSVIMRGIIYITVVFLTYLLATYPTLEGETMRRAELAFYGLLALAVGLTIRYSRRIEFRTTPTDYLLVFIVLAIGILPGEIFSGNEVAIGLIKAVILIYACEVLLLAGLRRWGPLSLSSLFALGWLAAAGLL
ncbi:MAG: undecaprenyl/decaprenyl-phosphate alpha-N-acetylglucosaminyl 1-phosphate transferase [Gammaproteobacteria bacterium]|nr:undecaprenyl/decaprenyl-phosphate alpha-N-acetylglucosaminyl 1-phosphate transferase [Gammaproteobacteria bacterium]NNM20561.1 undecaprenyl/decaprenyl-phosphate alpha-N-acetylglucosaminyl 1-phosphate transferase [Gammaproteobacteria bacterium]